MSLENLLKGILAAEGVPVLNKNGVSKTYLTHELARLAGKITRLKFTADEKQLLSTLAVYVKGAGRFPLPRTWQEITVTGHSDTEYDAEIALWGRLYEHLRRVGWIVKADGSKLDFVKQPAQAAPP